MGTTSSKRYKGVRLVAIKIIRLDDNIESGWGHITLEGMSEYAAKYRKGSLLTDEEKYQDALKLYNPGIASRENCIHRVNNFINICKSFNSYGLVIPFYSSLENVSSVFNQFESTRPEFFLPRFLNETPLRINEGRHRLSIIKSTGAVYIPACIVEEVEFASEEKLITSYQHLGAHINRQLVSFLLSEEWVEYKKTKDWLTLFRSK